MYTEKEEKKKKRKKKNEELECLRNLQEIATASKVVGKKKKEIWRHSPLLFTKYLDPDEDDVVMFL